MRAFFLAMLKKGLHFNYHSFPAL